MSGWVLVALSIGLAAGFIYGFIEGRKFTLRQVLEEAKRINKPD